MWKYYANMMWWRGKTICWHIMLHCTIKLYVSELLELELKYVTEPNIYNWKDDFKIYKI